MKYNLDKLKKVDLRDVWPHEALDFTKWGSVEKVGVRASRSNDADLPGI